MRSHKGYTIWELTYRVLVTAEVPVLRGQAMGKYKLCVGISYIPKNKQLEVYAPAGSIVDDLADSSVTWLLEARAIESLSSKPVKESSKLITNLNLEISDEKKVITDGK